MVQVELERVEVLELLAMTVVHLEDAKTENEVSPRVALLMNLRDKLGDALREDLWATRGQRSGRQKPPWPSSAATRRAKSAPRS